PSSLSAGVLRDGMRGSGSGTCSAAGRCGVGRDGLLAVEAEGGLAGRELRLPRGAGLRGTGTGLERDLQGAVGGDDLGGDGRAAGGGDGGDQHVLRSEERRVGEAGGGWWGKRRRKRE